MAFRSVGRTRGGKSSINRLGKKEAISAGASVAKAYTFSVRRTAGTPPFPLRIPTVPPPFPFYASKVDSRPPDCRCTECPRHSGRGAMSPSFLWLESGRGEGRRGQRKSKEWGK